MAFDGLDTRSFELGDARIHARIGGHGPLLMLLHGYPQTHMIWASVAARLADRFTLVLVGAGAWKEAEVRARVQAALDAGHKIKLLLDVQLAKA